MAVLSSQALSSHYRPRVYSKQPSFYQNRNGSKFEIANATYQIQWLIILDLDPAILAGSTDITLKTIQRTDELIENLPRMDETSRQMSELWAIAYPQLKTLLSKAGAWANQIPVPGRRKRSPQFFYQQGGNDAFNQIASDVMQCECSKLYTYILNIT